MKPSRFNIRVYGIFVDGSRLLVTDEIRLGVQMTKLPGGGLKFGEGLEECLKREWMEELEAKIEVGELFYVNPFLQVSRFRETDQVLCVYFLVNSWEGPGIRFTDRVFDFPTGNEGDQVFRWIALDALTESDFTFPIDRSLVPRLKSHFRKESVVDQNSRLK
jgi:ADP-ribose pyrophosphatase YjhB (NUDIX family)